MHNHPRVFSERNKSDHFDVGFISGQQPVHAFEALVGPCKVQRRLARVSETAFAFGRSERTSLKETYKMKVSYLVALGAIPKFVGRPSGYAPCATYKTRAPPRLLTDLSALHLCKPTKRRSVT